MALDFVSEDIIILKDHKAVLEFQNNTADISDRGHAHSIIKSGKIAKYEVAKWGADNQKPQQILKLIRENHVKLQLLQTEKDFLLGSRLGMFTKRIEGGKFIIEPVEDEEIEEWLEAVNINDYLLKAASNYTYFWNIPSYVSLGSNGKVEGLDVIDCNQIRAEVFKKGIINRYFIHTDWRNPKEKDIVIKPAYNSLKPDAHGSFVHWVKNPVPGQPYYSFPAWWGTEEWTKLANLIPKYHNHGFENGYNLKYRISVPFAYVLKMTGGSEDPAKIEEVKRKIATDMDQWLSGVKNKDKALITFTFVDHMGKETAGWNVQPLDNKLTDHAYVNLDKQANINQASGHGIDPALAGVDTGGKLGGSGSEKRISYQLHIALRTPQARQRLLDSLNRVVIPLNGWREKKIFFGIEDIDLTTLDKNPTGTQAVVNQSM